MSHFVAYILQLQEIIVYKIPPGGGGGGSIASLRSIISDGDKDVYFYVHMVYWLVHMVISSRVHIKNSSTHPFVNVM